jgi:hypothetical protein
LGTSENSRKGQTRYERTRFSNPDFPKIFGYERCSFDIRVVVGLNTLYRNSILDYGDRIRTGYAPTGRYAPANKSSRFNSPED